MPFFKMLITCDLHDYSNESSSQKSRFTFNRNRFPHARERQINGGIDLEYQKVVDSPDGSGILFLQRKR